MTQKKRLARLVMAIVVVLILSFGVIGSSALSLDVEHEHSYDNYTVCYR